MLQVGLPIIKIDRWIRVPKALLAHLETEKKRLTVPNFAKHAARQRGFDRKGPDEFLLYKEDKQFLYVPRAHRPKLRPDLVPGKDYLVVDLIARRLANGREPAGQDLVTLGPNPEQPFNQNPAFDALLTNNGSWPHGRQLGLRCGAGKTVIGLKSAHHYGGNFLWVTTTTLLLEDMLGERKGIPKWLGVKREDICLVQGAKCDWRGKRIGVAMLHSLALHEYEPEFYDHWDLVIFDEGDMLGCEHFCDVAPRFPGERWLFSATLSRADQMEVLFKYHIGPVCYQHLEYDMKPECYFYQHSSNPKLLARAGWDVKNHERRVSFQATAKNLMMDEERTRVVIDKIRRATENEGRTVLVLGDSVDGLLYMSKMAREELPHLTHGVIVGKVPQNKRDAILQSNRVVWATTRLGYRGLDKPVADTVIAVSLVAVNVQFWRQVVGRVLRFISDKPLPKVVIITDTTIGPVVALAAKLARIFKSEGWTRIGDAPLHEAQRKRREEKQYEQQSRGEEDDHF